MIRCIIAIDSQTDNTAQVAQAHDKWSSSVLRLDPAAKFES